MKEIALIMVFGAVGALLRFGITKTAYHWLGSGFPYGTLIANLAGCFIIGVMMTSKLPISKYMVSGIVVGFLGALTTFSSFGYATFDLFKMGAVGPALANVGLNLFLGLLAVWLGASLGRALVG